MRVLHDTTSNFDHSGTHPFHVICTAVGCLLCSLFLGSRVDFSSALGTTTMIMATGGSWLLCAVTLTWTAMDSPAQPRNQKLWLVAGGSTLVSLTLVRAFMGDSSMSVPIILVLCCCCVGSILFLAGKNRLLRRRVSSFAESSPVPRYENQSGQAQAILSERNLCASSKVDLLLGPREAATNSLAQYLTGISDCFFAADNLHLYETVKKVKENEERGTKETVTDKVSTFDAQASVAHSEMSASHTLVEQKCLSKETKEFPVFSTTILADKSDEMNAVNERSLLISRESAEARQGACRDGSNITTLELSSSDSISPEEEEEEDALTFFRNFLSTDKERLDRRITTMSSNGKKRRKRRSKTKTALLPLSSSSLTNGENISKADASPKEGSEEDLKQRESPTKEYLADDVISTTKSLCNHNQRSVRFADEEGRNMESVFHISSRHLGVCGTNDRRVLILLLLPQQQVFEFVGLEYSMNKLERNKENEQDVSITVSQILRELPSLATDPIVSKETYVALVRAEAKQCSDADYSSIDSDFIQECNLSDDEVLLADPKGYIPRVIVENSRTVLQNKKLLRSLTKNKRWGTKL